MNTNTFYEKLAIIVSFILFVAPMFTVIYVPSFKPWLVEHNLIGWIFPYMLLMFFAGIFFSNIFYIRSLQQRQR